MRVALVQCPAWGALPPLGPAALKAYLQANGHEARCFDLNIQFYNEQQQRRKVPALVGVVYGEPDPWGADSYGQWELDFDGRVNFPAGSIYRDRPLPLDDWARQILEFSPQVVGFTTYNTSLTASLQLAQVIRQHDPSVALLFGGPHVARDQNGAEALRTGVPDLVVHGEGEETLLEILRVLEVRGDPTSVAGTGHLVGAKPVWNKGRPLIAKVDTLPYPDFSDFDWNDYPNPYLVPIMASRGCVLNCAFCYETVYWKRFRTQSPERIVVEMEHQVANHPLKAEADAAGRKLYFMFADSLVNGHLGGLRRMSELLIERDTDITWGGQATINTKMDDDFIRTINAGGCVGLAFGLESGSQQVLDTMGKKFDIREAGDFLRSCHQGGITPTVNVMVGFPTETFRDFLDTLKFLTKTRRWIYQVSNVTSTQIALGSALDIDPDKYGVVRHPDGSWESPQAGDARQRRRRLQILHLWMRVFRIPHQNIAPD